MKTFDIYCGGEFITTENVLEVKSPYDNKLVATTFFAGDAELELAIERAKAQEKTMREMPSFLKYEILMDIADRISKNREEFTGLLAMEACKPWKLASAEIDRAIFVFQIAAEESKRLPKEYISLDWLPGGAGKEGLIKYFPVGLVAGISPFNFPLMLAVHKIAPDLAAGKVIILKPSSSTPLSTLRLAQEIDKTSLPKGALSIMPMNRTVGNRLVTDERFKVLNFTGSPSVGWKMKSQCGKKKVLLELGGNAGAIVTKNCDFEKALNRCVYGAFAYSGQVCIHTQRIFVDAAIFENFTKEFVEKVKLMKQGSPLAKDTDISAMIDEDNAIRVETWVNEAVTQGAKLLYGGKRSGSYIEPTVLTNTKNNMKVQCMEVFGPVVNIEPFTSLDEVVKEINNSDFGLQAGIFTNDISDMDYAFNNLVVGGVIVNDVPTFRVDHMPYGGVKDSGLGREGIKYAIAEVMEPRILVK